MTERQMRFNIKNSVDNNIYINETNNKNRTMNYDYEKIENCVPCYGRISTTGLVINPAGREGSVYKKIRLTVYTAHQIEYQNKFERSNTCNYKTELL